MWRLILWWSGSLIWWYLPAALIHWHTIWSDCRHRRIEDRVALLLDDLRALLLDLVVGHAEHVLLDPVVRIEGADVGLHAL